MTVIELFKILITKLSVWYFDACQIVSLNDCADFLLGVRTKFDISILTQLSLTCYLKGVTSVKVVFFQSNFYNNLYSGYNGFQLTYLKSNLLHYTLNLTFLKATFVIIFLKTFSLLFNKLSWSRMLGTLSSTA